MSVTFTVDRALLFRSIAVRVASDDIPETPRRWTRTAVERAVRWDIETGGHAGLESPWTDAVDRYDDDRDAIIDAATIRANAIIHDTFPELRGWGE
jgi:hypothetical protein